MIEVENVSKTYGQVNAVTNVSFTARDGRVTGFLGPNGAGKSTTMRMMAGIEHPDQGQCHVSGANPSALRYPIGTLGVLLDGQGAIPGMRARDYVLSVAAPCRIGTARVDQLLELVGLQDAARRRIRTYSLGMKQRLGLAVALLGDPDHLILDEPINGLDPDGVIWIRTLLRKLASEGRCVLLSSHLMSELEQCVDDLVLINGGELLRTGPLDAIVKTDRQSALVDSNDNTRLSAALTSAGGKVTSDGEHLRVADMSPLEIGSAAYNAEVVLALLTPERIGLESAYLSIIGSKEVRK